MCSRSSADQNWQHSAGSYNTHKALKDGNREIGKSNRVPCHHPWLPPPVSQQMLCSTKTLSAARQCAEICWQWRRGLMQGQKKKRKKKKKSTKTRRSQSASEFTMTTAPGRSVACERTRRPLSRNWAYYYGNTPIPLLWSTHIHARTCQLQARRYLSPDGGELHNSYLSLASKGMLKGLSNSQWTSPKNTEREKQAIWSQTVGKPLSCPSP